MHSVSIVTRGTPGLTADARLAEAALRHDGTVGRVYAARVRNRWSLAGRLRIRLEQAVQGGALPLANFFMENIVPQWLPLARRNVLFPNQEWCRESTVRLLDRMDVIACKTRFAEEIYGARGLRTWFTGFTSEDRLDASIERDGNAALHLAGGSLQKGTDTLVEVWRRHPEWPLLTVVTTQEGLATGAAGAANIMVVRERLPAGRIAWLQNRCPLHLCPSEAEGFGHYIGEALSCGAMVVTTDAPPMNELVAPGRGLLAAYNRTEPQSLGTNFHVEADALEAAIQRALDMDIEARAAIGAAARRFFLDQRADFETRLAALLKEL